MVNTPFPATDRKGGVGGELRKTKKIWITIGRQGLPTVTEHCAHQLQNTHSSPLSGSQQGQEPSRGHLAMSGDIFVGMSCGMLLASCRQKSEMLVNNLKCTGQHPTIKNYLILNVKFQGWETLFSCSFKRADYVLAFETCHGKFTKTETRQHIFPNCSEIKF